MITISATNFIVLVSMGWIVLIARATKTWPSYVLPIAAVLASLAFTAVESRSDSAAHDACAAERAEGEEVIVNAQLCGSVFSCPSGSDSLCVFRSRAGYRSTVVKQP